MEKKSQNLTKNEIEQVLDSYFEKLGNQVVAYIKEFYPIKALTLKTADDINLEFPEAIQESSQIEVGTSPVKIDGRLADGEFVMPDGVTLEIKEGKVTKIVQPTPEEIVARMKGEVKKIRKDMKAFRNQLKAYIVRTPFKTKAKVVTTGGNRVPFHKPSK